LTYQALGDQPKARAALEEAEHIMMSSPEAMMESELPMQEARSTIFKH
jgi:hypothetical protein